jgi:hypothetical protein
MESTVAEELAKLKLKQEEIVAIKTDIDNLEDDEGDQKTGLEEKLREAEKKEGDMKNEIIQLMMKRSEPPNQDSQHLLQSPSEPHWNVNATPAPDLLAFNAIKQNPSTLARTFHFTPKLPVLQQYKHGENFLTWSSRFKRFLKIGKYTLDENIIELLLQNIDDTTVDKLEPIVEAMSPNQRANPELFFPLLEQAMYPEAEVRGWRQELSGGTVSQGIDEDIETYAAKIRSLAKKAYNNPSDRNEPCLNAFLNGLKDSDVHNMIISHPGSDLDKDFEKAVAAARNFESRRRNRSQNSIPSASPIDVLRINKNESSEQRQPRSQEQGHHDGNHNSYRRNDDYQRDNFPRRGNHERRYRDPRDRETRRCWYCHKIGHIREHCNLRKKDLNSHRAGQTNNGRVNNDQ